MADESLDRAKYWSQQIASAEAEPRRKQWLDVGNQFYRRLTLEGEGQAMRHGVANAGRVDIYNLFYSNVKIQLPMLYSRLPEPHIQREFGNRDPVARMAATIAERATMVDLKRDDFDDQAERLAKDRLVVGRGVMRVLYEASIVNSRIPVREENRERGEPAYVTEQGDTIPGKLVKRDERGLFALDPQTKDERAPLCYHFWRDFLVGPGRTWRDVVKHGWIDWQCYMTKADSARRFGQEKANMLSYSYSPYQLADAHAQDGRVDSQREDSLGHLVKVHEIWDAKSRKVVWVADAAGGAGALMLDEQDDPLQLEQFFNTPRPLLTLHSNESLIPTPDYAQYRPQAAEMDQVTAKIGELIKALRPGGVYNGNADGLGNFLESDGEWRAVDNWEAFASQGGIDGAIQQFDNTQLMGVVTGLYQHRDAVKADADMVAGIPDVFRGQQAERDERLGQTHKRTSLGGLRINDDQRDFQRYLSDALALKTEVIVRHFDDTRLLQMADVQALIMESPKVMQLDLMAESPQGEQVLALARQAQQMQQQALLTGIPPNVPPEAAEQMAQALQTFNQWQRQREQAVNEQMALVRNALQLLRSDQMRTFKLSIETDATVAVDEAEEKAQATEFVATMSQMLNEVLSSQAIATSPELKALAARMLLFVVRRYRIGRSLEQEFEDTITKLVTAPPQQPPPDAVMEDVKRQAAKDQADALDDERTAAIKTFEANIKAYQAVTERQKAAAEAMQAAKEGDRGDLDLAARILQTEALQSVN